MKKRTIIERPGWDACRAVRHGHIYEIKSTYILQPGPAALTEGVRQAARPVALRDGRARSPELMPEERIDPDAAD